jgi:cytidyltransferase-like protein
MKIVIVTGGFDPIHSGHIEYFKAAKALGDLLIVGVNSDAWLVRKKGKTFMPSTERIAIVENLKVVDNVLLFNDDDDSAREAIKNVRQLYPKDTIIFANGGDRTHTNIPEMDVNDDNLNFVFGVGGFNKTNSSSWILEEWKSPKTERPWGYYRVLHEVSGCKVKELTVDPGQSLSMQRHFNRHELWHVTEGKCIVNQQMHGGYQLPPLELTTHSQLSIPQGDWHQLTNPYEVPCKIVEIQYGTNCVEEDIERR